MREHQAHLADGLEVVSPVPASNGCAIFSFLSRSQEFRLRNRFRLMLLVFFHGQTCVFSQLHLSLIFFVRVVCCSAPHFSFLFFCSLVCTHALPRATRSAAPTRPSLSSLFCFRCTQYPSHKKSETVRAAVLRGCSCRTAFLSCLLRRRFSCVPSAPYGATFCFWPAPSTRASFAIARIFLLLQ